MPWFRRRKLSAEAQARIDRLREEHWAALNRANGNIGTVSFAAVRSQRERKLARKGK